jgi:hypothetical protein
MPRFNVEHNGKWACFSTISDGFVTNFMDRAEYEKWRLEEYGRANYVPAEECNIYTIADAVNARSLNHSKKETIENIVEAGIDISEAEKLWYAHKVKPGEMQMECERCDKDISNDYNDDDIHGQNGKCAHCGQRLCRECADWQDTDCNDSVCAECHEIIYKHEGDR